MFDSPKINTRKTAIFFPQLILVFPGPIQPIGVHFHPQAPQRLLTFQLGDEKGDSVDCTLFYLRLHFRISYRFSKRISTSLFPNDYSFIVRAVKFTPTGGVKVFRGGREGRQHKMLVINCDDNFPLGIRNSNCHYFGFHFFKYLT